MGILSKLSESTKGISKKFLDKNALSEASNFKIQNISLQDMAKPVVDRASRRARAMDLPAAKSEQIREINTLKQDLSKTVTALRESMRLNKNSIVEIEKLNGFMKTSELNVVSIERLMPENADLKTQLEVAQSDITNKKVWISELESKSVAYKNRFEETSLELDTCRGQILEQDERIREQIGKYANLNVEYDLSLNENRGLEVKQASLESAQLVLQDDISSLREIELLLSRQNTELEKQSGMLNARVEDEKNGREAAEADLKVLRLDYSELKSTQIEALSKLEKIKYERNTHQTSMSDVRLRNDDKVFALNAMIDGLKAQLKVNSEMSDYDKLDKMKLKANAERNARRVEEMSGRLDQETVDLAENRSALADVEANYSALKDRFINLLAEMEDLKVDHHKQAKKLGEYSSISGIAVGQSFYDNGRAGQNGAIGQAHVTTSNKSSMPSLKLVKDPTK